MAGSQSGSETVKVNVYIYKVNDPPEWDVTALPVPGTHSGGQGGGGGSA